MPFSQQSSSPVTPTPPVYFGGGRYCSAFGLIAQVVSSVSSVHVGCQVGADLGVIQACLGFSIPVHVFTVQPQAFAPSHVVSAAQSPCVSVSWQAGGKAAPIKARYLLRSIAGFQGCSTAVFFHPGSGSLAVAREAIKAGLPVFAFSVQAQEPPAPIPATVGSWVRSSFHGFTCWQFKPAQANLL